MIKVGILTINDYSNYGNRLQNYALQEVLIDIGCEVKTIVQDRSSLSETSSKTNAQKVQSLLNVSNQEKLKLIRSKIEAKINSKYRMVKINNLKKFTSMNIKEATGKVSINNIPDSLINNYDYFITGSDQVWNPNFGFGNEIDFLEFAPRSKRIAYAPSFGVSQLSEQYTERYSTHLLNMGKISVREEAGAKIIYDLTGITAEVLLDPTLLLEKERWLSIAVKDFNKPQGKFLLTYILGDLNDSCKEFINELAKKNNLEVINLASYKDKQRYTICPGAFIDYINTAEVIITNSFHGAVFSILLEKPFVVLDRSGMNSRINTLLSKFDLEHRKFDNIVKNNEVFKIDFSHVQPILLNERDKSIVYLKDALNIEDES